MKKVLLVIAFLIILSAAYFISDYLAIFKSNKVNEVNNLEISNEPVEYEVKEVISNLYVPWSIAFTDNNRMLITERNGNIRVYENEKLNPNPLITFKVSTKSEEGLMGLAIDPNYVTNKYLYVCYAYESATGLTDKVVRIVDLGNNAIEDKVLIDNIPAAANHAGCRVKFGPDNKLYVTTGDATDKKLAQNLESLGGKILRINTDGSIPEDNPFKNSPIYTYGHRNPQGIAWDLTSGTMLETEHGPSIFDGPAGGDEINLIIAGKNYGWPLVSHEKSIPTAQDPLVVYTPAVAPASAMVYSGKLFSQFKNDLFFGGLRGEGLFRVWFKDDLYTKVENWEKLVDNLGRIREVVEAPNGEIYFTTSNRDGRGKPKEGDDKVYKLTAKSIGELDKL